MAKWFSLLVGGVSGTFARYLLEGTVHRFVGTNFPYGTLVVNLSGCFLVGFLAALAEEKFVLSSNARVLLMVGFCGAFTTFSTFMLETVNLLKDGETIRAMLNISFSIIFGFLLLKLGLIVGETI
ncbi:MAG: fluoride efflux transporter CrcB [Candidatus Omnitrophica bacterium]|nr:fluoride efflux transporter CrcB [Candidatus Omnitrophota bacterium]